MRLPRLSPRVSLKIDPRVRAFLRGHGTALGVGAGSVLLLGVTALLLWSGDAPPKRKIPEITMVTIQPPPPPPEPEITPPEQEEVAEEEPEMVEQPEVDEPEPKPEPEEELQDDEPLPEVDSEAPPEPGSDLEPLGMDALGEGPGDAFNLAGRPGGRGLLSGRGGGGSRWGWYAYIVQEQVEKALREHKRTRLFTGRLEVRLWTDGSGRIIRAELAPSTGDAAVDAAIRNEVLVGLKLKEPPPAEMPMPIVARLTARRPG